MAETADMLTQNHQKVVLPDLNAGCSMADMAEEMDIEEAWKQLGRHDVLSWVGISRRADGEPSYRIWVEPGSTTLAKQCPFLEHLPAENRWVCRIHNVKPHICREYPVSRKHGTMTGCPGFSN